MYNGKVQQNPLCVESCVTKVFAISPRFSPTIFDHRLYAQNPVFEIVHDESVKVYPHMYNGKVQQNPLCVESCVTKVFAISPRFSPTIFDPDANYTTTRRTENAFEKRRLPASVCLFSLQPCMALFRTVLRTTTIQQARHEPHITPTPVLS